MQRDGRIRLSLYIFVTFLSKSLQMSIFICTFAEENQRTMKIEDFRQQAAISALQAVVEAKMGLAMELDPDFAASMAERLADSLTRRMFNKPTPILPADLDGDVDVVLKKLCNLLDVAVGKDIVSIETCQSLKKWLEKNIKK